MSISLDRVVVLQLVAATRSHICADHSILPIYKRVTCQSELDLDLTLIYRV